MGDISHSNHNTLNINLLLFFFFVTCTILPHDFCRRKHCVKFSKEWTYLRAFLSLPIYHMSVWRLQGGHQRFGKSLWSNGMAAQGSLGCATLNREAHTLGSSPGINHDWVRTLGIRGLDSTLCKGAALLSVSDLLKLGTTQSQTSGSSRSPAPPQSSWMEQRHALSAHGRLALLVETKTARLSD